MRGALAVVILAGCGLIGFDVSARAGDGGGLDSLVDSMVVGDGPRPAANLVFVTSIGYTGTQIGSLTNADNICRDRANAGALGGTYVAWLSTSSVSALSRISGRGWVRLDGLPVADTISDLQFSRLHRPIAYDEFGNHVFDAPVITGTMSGGTFSGENCADFAAANGTTTSGLAESTLYFSQYASSPCVLKFRLFCFEVDRNVQVLEQTPGPHRYAFAGSVSGPGSGRAYLDMHCAMEASQAPLPGTYKAFVATTTMSAASQFSSTGANWYRPDNVQIAATPAAFLAGEWIAPINIPASASGVQSGNAWFGADSPTVVGTAGSTCNDWNLNAAVPGTTGNASMVGARAFRESTQTPCNTANAIYCVQQ